MTKLFLSILEDFSQGFIDSIRGLSFLRELDQDAEYEEVSSPAPQRKTVLQMRREMNGAVVRPPQRVIRHRERVWKRVLQCAAVNLTIIVFLAFLTFIMSFFIGFFTDTKYGILASNLFCLPIFLITRILMALWFSDIAGACHRQLNLPNPQQIDFRFALADTLVSLMLGFVFLGQGFLAEYFPLPIVSTVLMWIHMALLNSMYSFEYFWSARSWILGKRVCILESHWPYFVGFGTPLTLLSSLSSNALINGCIFATLFPFFIISSYRAAWNRSYRVEIPRVPIFTPSMRITNKLSLLISSYLLST